MTIFSSMFFNSIIPVQAAEPVKVRVAKFRISDNYDTSLYGGRLEPKQIMKLYAPVSGLISNIYVSEGTYVDKNTAILSITRKSSGGVTYNPTLLTAASLGMMVNISATLGQEVFEKTEIATLADISIYRIYLMVSDREINLLKTGSDCYIQGKDRMTGKITKVSLLPENKTGLFKVEATFEKSPELYIGKFVTVEIHTNFTKGISVPQNLIYNRYGKTYLYLVEHNAVSMREVKITNTFGAKVVVEGVTPDELYIIYSEGNVNDGDKVLIEEEPKNKSENGNNRTRG
jgi:multidrug efflux pump subunit AcrA (membrane-fusion protein)